MKRIALATGAVLAAVTVAATPAVLGLSGNPSFGHRIPVPVPTRAQPVRFAQPTTGASPVAASSASRTPEAGSSPGRRTTEPEAGDDRSSPREDRAPGDDRSSIGSASRSDADRGRRIGAHHDSERPAGGDSSSEDRTGDGGTHGGRR